MLEPPHTEENYLLQEMGFRIARKHARRLRRIARLAGFALPALATLFALFLGGAPGATAAALGVVERRTRPGRRALAVFRRGPAYGYPLLWGRGGLTASAGPMLYRLGSE